MQPHTMCQHHRVSDGQTWKSPQAFSVVHGKVLSRGRFNEVAFRYHTTASAVTSQFFSWQQPVMRGWPMPTIRQNASSGVRHMLRFTWHHGGDPTSNAPSYVMGSNIPLWDASNTRNRFLIPGQVLRSREERSSYGHLPLTTPIPIGSLHDTIHFGECELVRLGNLRRRSAWCMEKYHHGGG